MTEPSSGSASGRNLALVGGTIYASPEHDPIPDGVVLITGGKISAVGRRDQLLPPRDFETLDCGGATVTAGFANSHVHFFERKWANAGAIPAGELARQFEDMLSRYGFTSAFDLGSAWENTRQLRERVESGVPGPRIRSTGEGLLPRDPGLPSDAVTNFMGLIKTPFPEVGEASEAAETARRLLAAGVDAIKLFVSAPSKSTIPEAAIAAAVEEAHAAGKPVFIHPNNAADVLGAVRNGVDIIGHTTPMSGPWEEAMIASMLERRVALTPTLTLWKYYLRHDRASVQERTVQTAVGQLAAWVAAGGSVLYGSDLGAVDYDPTQEYLLMGQAGMDFRAVLASLTTAPAERFGDGERLGRLAPGYEADLAVVEGDPSLDLRDLARVRYTLRAGGLIFRAH